MGLGPKAYDRLCSTRGLLPVSNMLFPQTVYLYLVYIAHVIVGRAGPTIFFKRHGSGEILSPRCGRGNSPMTKPIPMAWCSLPHTSDTRAFDATNIPLNSPSRNLGRRPEAIIIFYACYGRGATTICFPSTSREELHTPPRDMSYSRRKIKVLPGDTIPCPKYTMKHIANNRMKVRPFRVKEPENS